MVIFVNLLMKNHLLILLVILSASTLGFAQKKSLPTSANETIQSLYEGAEVQSFRKSGDTFKVKIVNAGVKKLVHLDSNGSWIQTEYSIKEGELPEAVIKSVKKNGGKGAIRRIDVLEKANTLSVYDVLVANPNNSVTNYKVDEKGTLIKKEVGAAIPPSTVVSGDQE